MTSITEDIVQNRGELLTILNNKEAKKFIKKYERSIFLECKKMSYLPLFSTDDLVQECKIKLLAGYHLFDKTKSSEKTWVYNIVRKTLNGLWSYSIKESRSCYIQGEDGKEKPCYNYSWEGSIEKIDEGEPISFEDKYKCPCDGRPTFASPNYSAEDLILAIETISVLKKHLEPEILEYVTNKITYNKYLGEIADLEEQFRHEEMEEGFSHIRKKTDHMILGRFCDISLSEAKILLLVAEVMIEHLGYDREFLINAGILSECNIEPCKEEKEQ